MKNLLPIPTANHIPPVYEDATPLTDMLDDQFQSWYDDTVRIEQNKEPVRAPSEFLNTFGEMVAAGIVIGDTERVKRVKIQLSQDFNRRKGMWQTVKPIIDAFCGGDSNFVFTWHTDIALGWTLQGLDGDINGEAALSGISAHVVGIKLIGVEEQDPTPIILKGVFMIDVDNSTLTTQQVEDLKRSVENQIAAYFSVYLGYQYGGAFQEYPNGGINV